jgi:hypothetical protein
METFISTLQRCTHDAHEFHCLVSKKKKIEIITFVPTAVLLSQTQIPGVGKSLARPTSQCILFDG